MTRAKNDYFIRHNKEKGYWELLQWIQDEEKPWCWHKLPIEIGASPLALFLRIPAVAKRDKRFYLHITAKEI